jgi:MYXO-CTERM domain-containing protein
MRPWIILPPACLPLLACLAAPGAPGSGPEQTATESSPIYGGVLDNDSKQNDAVVAVKIGPPGATMVTLCSGALVAPNVVLTARHCVSVMNSTQITCDENGVSATAPDFGADQPIANIGIYTGPTAGLGGQPVASAKAVFHAAGTTLCNLDLALIVLDTNVTVAPPLTVRLKAPVLASESVRAVGYGQNDQGAPVGTRFRKDGVSVLAVGSTVSASMTPLGSNEFELGESMCEGDSGGPAIDETSGAIVGVVSRGGACTDPSGHVYTSLAGLEPVFQQAFAMAGGAPIDEGQPVPTPDAGTASSSGSSSGGVEPSSGSGSSSGAGATGGRAASGEPVNLRAGAGNGCSMTGVSSSGGAFWLAGAALLLAARRRRHVVHICSKVG